MNHSSYNVWAIIPAAGAGQRMGLSTPKQYLKLGQYTILQHSLYAMASDSRIKAIMVALSKDDDYWQSPDLAIPVHITEGGKERCDSVLNALQALSGMANDDDWVLVHDAARPCLNKEDLSRLIDCIDEGVVGAILASPVSDTIKQEDGQQYIQQTVDRRLLWRALTPQMFPYGLLKAALIDALKQGVNITDDASAMEYHNHTVRLVKGKSSNIKITQHDDLELAKVYLTQQGRL